MKSTTSHFPNLVSYIDYTEGLRNFLLNSLFSMLINPADSEILCYASIVKDNITFKGLSRKESVPPGWVDIQWVDPRTKELSYVPAKILLFIDLKKAEFSQRYQDTSIRLTCCNSILNKDIYKRCHFIASSTNLFQSVVRTG